MNSNRLKSPQRRPKYRREPCDSIHKALCGTLMRDYAICRHVTAVLCALRYFGVVYLSEEN